ncbi:MAG: hypothetical protein FWD25_08255 [Clostridia bacterium]|nr:hypothetical protein [Clostridia bacterium]
MTGVSLLTARQLLREVTPLKADCGRICGAACCQPYPAQDGEASGMYLFPGEERLYGPDDTWAQVLPTDWVAPLLVCQGTCPRERRPLACRLFPLCARPEGEGFALRLDPRAWPVCALMPHGLAGLDPAFVAAAKAAFTVLWADEEQKAFLFELDRLL